MPAAQHECAGFFALIAMSKRVSAGSSNGAPPKRSRPAATADAAFPRGGGSSLTPLEYRAAVKSADSDVLFSSKSSTPTSGKALMNRQTKQNKKESKHGSQAQEAQTRKAIGLDESTQSGPKVVESLKYKYLTPGSKVLCAVSEISDSGIIMSLPNCLTGTVGAEHMPMPNVQFSQCVSVGDVLCAVVVGLSKDGKKNALALSLLPSDVGSGMAVDNVSPDQVVQGVVRSLEDHGAVLDIGIAGCSAFFPQKYFHHIPKPLCAGCIIRVSVESVNASRAVVKCSLSSSAPPIGKPVRESDAPSVSTAMPGQLLKAKVTSVFDGGVVAVGPGGLYVTIDSFHVDYSGSDLSKPATPPSVVNTGDTLTCRLTFVDKIQHRFCASALKHLISSAAVDYKDLEPGTTIQSCVVRRIDPSVGLYLSTPDSAQFLFVHASRVADERIEKLERAFHVSQEVPCRILGHSLIDGFALATMKPSALNEEIVHFGDLKLGNFVKGRVASVEKTGIRISLSATSAITGFIPIMHCSDSGTQSFLKKAKVGKKMKCRIIKLEPSHRRVLLTAKPSLLEADGMMFSSYDQCTPSAPSCGFVSKIEDKFLIVAFCGEVHGIMFKKDLDLEPEESIEDNFTLGQPLKCFVSSCSAREKKLRLCLRKREASASTSGLPIGSVQEVVVSEKSDSHITCAIGKTTCVIPKFHVCDVLGHVDRAFERIEIGQSLKAVVIENSPRVSLSLKPLLLESIPSKPETLSDLVVGRVLAGYVKNITSFGVFVSILPGLTAFANKSALSDSFVADPSKLFDLDQSVLVRVDSVDLEQSRISVSLKLSAIGEHHVFLSHFFAERALLFGPESVTFRAGTKVDAEVVACTSSGAVIDLGQLGDGVLDASQWDSAPAAGSTVPCIVVDYCEAKECLEVCAKKKIVSIKMSEKSTNSAIKKCQSNNSVFDVTVELIRKEYAIVRAATLQDALCILTNAHFNFQNCQFSVGQTIKSVSVVKNGDSECGHIVLQQSSNLIALPKDAQSSSSAANLSEKAVPGNIVSGKVTSIDNMQLNIRLGAGQKGRVHISEVQNPSTHDVSSGNPFRLSQFTIGQETRVRVLQMRDDGLLELSMRLSDDDTKRPTLSTLAVGDEIIGFAQGASADGVWLQLAPGLRGRVHPLDAGCSSKDVLNVNHIADGTPLSAVVVRVDVGSKVIDLTLRRPAHPKVKSASSNGSMLLRGIVVGATVPCKITRVIPGAALLVSLAPHTQGRISIIDISDQLLADPFAAFSVGDVIDALVTEIEGTDSPVVHLTCRESKVFSSKMQDVAARADLNSYSDLFVGQVVNGYVRTSSKSGVFVTLGRKVSARVVLKDLSDKFVADIAKSYPPGKLVQGRITAVDTAEGHASLNLKTSVLSCLKRISMEDIVPGCIVLGKVKSTQSYGLFVSIDHSDLVGFVHISQMSGDFVKNVTQVAAVGDAVKAKVQKVEQGKIWLGMKSEDIQSGDVINDEGGSEAEDDSGDDESGSESSSDGEGSDDGDSESSASDDDSESDASTAASEDEDAEEEEVVTSATETLQSTSRPSAVPFAWDAFEQIASQNAIAPALSDSDESQASDDEDGGPKQNKQSRRRQARSQELEIRRQEEDLLSGAGAPTSINDFERLVVANPNSSIIWIRYMAFLLSLAEVDKARAVGERALKTIVFREESEKLNVWTSLLNLENMFGTSDSLFEKFKKACQFNDEKKVHFVFADILIRRGDDNLTLPFFKIFSRKFAQSGKVWTKLAELHLQKGRVDAFKETMERCVLAIPRRKHTKTIVKFILLEFNSGSAERGRTLMEGVLSQNPKRIDLWSVYVDMEIKVGEVERARSILDRIITLPIKARQMKFVFKKMLEVEKKHGGPEQVEEVKRKAREYVARNMQ